VLSELVSLARTLLTLAAILPGLVAGLATFVVTRDRRRAVNRSVAVWGELGTRAARIDLDVRGAAWLESARPCIFLINHQSGVDAIILCALLKRDFVGVAKAEIRRNPFLGPAFVFAGTIFVDRFDSARGAQALRPALDRLARGVSIAIAPEGTRAAGNEMGAFKKGGFRIAMAAGVPVVPIVICNSGDVLPRGAWIMRPARVRVVVHAPIVTDGWTLETLDAEIERVRTLYQSTLGSFATRREGDPGLDRAKPRRSSRHVRDDLGPR
jgi:putative phosphoserine phosphatase/1-acylglycerol-3-phosphate O-acyltransferase